jgi:phosphoribosylaminoimidazole carboxylase (NCAIR synthetase)
MEYVGVLGVELFVTGGRLLVNEMAPRPHNSGHYTLDACSVDQFEQQLRALCGLPLARGAALGRGAETPRRPAAPVWKVRGTAGPKDGPP